MAKSQVTQRYQEILAEAATGSPESAPAPASALERRVAPRVSVTCGDVAVNLTCPVTTVDISTTGACFLSEQAFSLGSELTVTVATAFSLAATVVGCEMEETDATFMETRYRVRCRFEDEAQEMELLVLASEHETLD